MAQLDKIRLSGTTYDIIDATAVHSLDGYYTTGETNAAITAATDALAQAIAEQGYQTATDVQNAISGKANSDDVYTKQQTDDRIDEKIAEASGVTTGQVQTMIDESISGKADASVAVNDVSFTRKSDGSELLYYLTRKSGTYPSAKVLGIGTGLTLDVNTQLKVDFTKVASKSSIPSVSGYADSVQYNSTSKYVEFYHGGTGGTKVFEYDASPFLIDGMVQNVEIKNVSGTQTFQTGYGSGYVMNPYFIATSYDNSATNATADGSNMAHDGNSAIYFTIKVMSTGGTETSVYANTQISASNTSALPPSSDYVTVTRSDYNFTIVPAEGYRISVLNMYSAKNSEHGGIPNVDKLCDLIVTAATTCLVISFNTDAGKQDINIPISQIFDASNYYTKAETNAKINQEVSGKVSTYTYTAYTANTQSVINAKADTTAMTQAISEATSGKADTTAVTQSINEAVSGKVDTSTYTAYTADTATALGGKASQSDLETVSGDVATKQDQLVSGTNIKTVGGNSLLGSGDIAFPTGLQVEVSGTTLVFS